MMGTASVTNAWVIGPSRKSLRRVFTHYLAIAAWLSLANFTKLRPLTFPGIRNLSRGTSTHNRRAVGYPLGSAKLDATLAEPAVPRTQAASATLSRERPSLRVAHQTSSSSIRCAKSLWKG